MSDKIARLKSVFSNWLVQFVLFSGILWLIFIILEINRHLKDMILGYHYWRKSDTYAQISNYYYNGLNFFDHSIYYNQLESGGRAVAEFPLFYYFIAFQQTIFGNYQIIAKINWILLLYIGLFSIFKIAQHYLKHVGFSLLVALILFTSPIYTAYAIDFLPDSVAINLIFIGFWLLLKSSLNHKTSTFIFAIILFSIAGMMKPFFLIPFIALLMVIISNHLFIKKEFIPFKWSLLIPILATILWFVYAHYYNSVTGGGNYFLSTTRAIWDYSAEETATTIYVIKVLWLNDYIHPLFRPFFLLIVLVNLVWWNKKTVLLNLFYVFSLLGGLAFFVLFFNMLEHHDYYVYPLIFLVPLTIGKFLFHIQPYLRSNALKHSLSLILLVLFYMSLTNTFNRVQSRRMDTRINGLVQYAGYQNLDAFLTRNGVKETDYVLAFSDKSPSHALSLMNRKGWSGYQTNYKLQKLPYLIEYGAKYLIINKRAKLLDDSTYTHGYTHFLVADTNDIFIYDLQPYQLKE